MYYNLNTARRTRRWIACAGLAACFVSVWIYAYNPEQEDVSRPVATRWAGNAFVWSINPSTGSNVSTTNGVSVTTAIQNAISTWAQASFNGQPLVNLTVTQGPNSTLTTPDSSDCQNVVGFVDSTSSDFSTGTIAFTEGFTVYGAPPINYLCGQTTRVCPYATCLTDADIEFNPADQFSTAPTPPRGSFDVQAIATHEFGHALGLDHSGLASAIMFPYGDSSGVVIRNLSTDDAAGIGFLYPSAAYNTITGSLGGNVQLGGTALFAAHVVALDASTGATVADGLTDTAGNFSIQGVPSGNYNIIALPLVGVYDISNFSGWACGFGENVPPCCDPTIPGSQCNTAGALKPDTNYSGKFY